MNADAGAASLRLDWRFLLENPALDCVGYLGPGDGDLLDALRDHCRSLDMLEGSAADGGSKPGNLDTVVACEPGERELVLAVSRLRPGGTLVVEVRGPMAGRIMNGPDRGGPVARRSRASLGRVTRRLRQLGFTDVRRFWHWPAFERCTRIVPLDDPAALRHALGHSSRLGGRLAAWLVMVFGTGLPGWAVSSASVIARRAGADTAPESGPGAILQLAEDGLPAGGDRGPAGLPFVVLTPRFSNSSHLVFLLLGPNGSDPVKVAKVARRAGRCERLAIEADRLREIHARRPGGYDSIPRLIALESRGGHDILVQTAIPGRGMDRTTVRRRPHRCCDAAVAWLLEVQGASSPGEPGRALGRPIEVDLAEIGTIVPQEGTLLARTRDLTAPLAEIPLAPVLEHGDLGHPNLLVDTNGRLGVIDWEQAELRGLPAVDLFFFLAYVARALADARSSATAVAALDRAFFLPRGWALPHVLRYSEVLGLSRRTLSPLFIACWIRQVAGLARRVADSSAGTPPGGLGEWLRRDWRFAVWRHSVEQARRLLWDNADGARP